MTLNDLRQPLQLNDTTQLKAVFDPALRCFSAQLWKDGEPAGLLGLVGEFTHPDDVLEAVDEFLIEKGESPLTEKQMGCFGGMLLWRRGALTPRCSRWP